MKIIAGLDVGNGYVKGAGHEAKSAEKMKADIPSGACSITTSSDIKTKPEDVPGVIDDIFNQMDISFDSPLIRDMNRHLFGERAVQSGKYVDEFDVFSALSKAKQEIGPTLTLATCAGLALKEYYKENGKLPEDTIKAKMRIALALPIDEFRDYRVQYADSYKAGTHVVTFHNFEQRVRIELEFEDVQVLAEGAAAQFAIAMNGVALIEAMITEAKKFDENFPNDITAEAVAQAQTVVGIDIGEGTINFPVFKDGKLNVDTSFSYNVGWGSVLERARERLSKTMPIKSRKELAALIETPAKTPMMERTRQKALAIVEEERISFVDEVIQQFRKVCGRVGTWIEVVYVYGGGAGKLKDRLYPALIKTSKDFDASYPVLYLDSVYSRNLNREGLLYIADMMAKQSEKADKKTTK